MGETARNALYPYNYSNKFKIKLTFNLTSNTFMRPSTEERNINCIHVRTEINANVNVFQMIRWQKKTIGKDEILPFLRNLQ